MCWNYANKWEKINLCACTQGKNKKLPIYSQLPWPQMLCARAAARTALFTFYTQFTQALSLTAMMSLQLERQIPSLEGFKARMDRVLSNLIRIWVGHCWNTGREGSGRAGKGTSNSKEVKSWCRTRNRTNLDRKSCPLQSNCKMLCCKYNLIVGDISNCTYLNWDTLTNQRSLFLEETSYYQKVSLWKSRQHLVILVSSWMGFEDHMKNKAALLACFSVCFLPTQTYKIFSPLWLAMYNSKQHLLRFSHSSSEAWAGLRR